MELYNINKREKYPFPEGDGFIYLRIAAINYVEADGKYSTFYMVDKKTHLISAPLCDAKLLLPSETFFRIHDSYVANVNQILKYTKSSRCIEMENGELLFVSKRIESEFLEFVRGKIDVGE